MIPMNTEAVCRKIASYAVSDCAFCTALRVSPAHALRRAHWLTHEERRTLTRAHVESLANVAKGIAGLERFPGWAKASKEHRLSMFGQMTNVSAGAATTLEAARVTDGFYDTSTQLASPTSQASSAPWTSFVTVEPATPSASQLKPTESTETIAELVTTFEARGPDRPTLPPSSELPPNQADLRPGLGAGLLGVPIEFQTVTLDSLGPGPTLTWEQAHNYGKYTYQKGGLWNAGCVAGVVVDGNGKVIVATDTGGLWLVDGTGQGEPLYDFDEPDFSAIARSSIGDKTTTHLHIFAGGTKLYENDPVTAKPGHYLDNWYEVPLPKEVTRINNILIHDRDFVGYGIHYIFIATNAGVWYVNFNGPRTIRATYWTRIQATYNYSSTMRDEIAVLGISLANSFQGTSTSTTSFDATTQPFFGLALGPLDPMLFLPNIVASTCDNTANPSVSPLNTIFYSVNKFSGYYLESTTIYGQDGKVYNPPQLQDASGNNVTPYYTNIALCSFTTDPTLMYAAVADNQDGGHLLAVLKSTNSGNTWSVITDAVTEGPTWRLVGDSQPASLQPIPDQMPPPGSPPGTPPTRQSLYDAAGNQWSFLPRQNCCIGVSTINRDIIVIGGSTGIFINLPMRGWVSIPEADSTPGSPGAVYADNHAFLFVSNSREILGRPFTATNSGETLYVCSDGGLVSTPDYGNTWNDKYNMRLLNFQFTSPSAHNGYGSIGINPNQNQSIFAAGAQDHGVLYSVTLESSATFLTPVLGGDGNEALFVPPSAGYQQPPLLLSWNNGDYLSQMTIAQWSDGNFKFLDPMPIIAYGTDNLNFDACSGPGQMLPPNDVADPVSQVIFKWGTPPTFFRAPVTELVTSNPYPYRMYAVAGGLLTSECYWDLGKIRNQPNTMYNTWHIFGLFGGPDPNAWFWTHIGYVPTMTFPGSSFREEVSAVACWKGLWVFVGTTAGRIFRLDLTDPTTVWAGTTVAEAMVLPAVAGLVPNFVSVGSPPGGPFNNGRGIGRIVVDSGGNAFAIWNSTYDLDWKMSQARSAIFRRSATADSNSGIFWSALANAPTDQAYFGLEIDDGDNLYAITDRQIIFSSDGGGNWAHTTNVGLPKTPHCADLRFVRFADMSGYLYLSTWGRSVWRARIG